MSMSIKTSAILPLLLLATLLPGQTLDLSLAPADPTNSFNTGPTGLNANLTNIVRTEGLSVTLTATLRLSCCCWRAVSISIRAAPSGRSGGVEMVIDSAGPAVAPVASSCRSLPMTTNTDASKPS